mgnify:CR=1 FL=1
MKKQMKTSQETSQAHDQLVAESRKIASLIVGLHREMAVDFINTHKLTCRVIKEDGHSLVTTRDYNSQRINLVVEGDLVQEAHVG